MLIFSCDYAKSITFCAESDCIPILSYIFLYILYPSDYSRTYITSSPMRVAEVLPVIRTRTVSPMW